MVDVSAKPATPRRAIAEARVLMAQETLSLIIDGAGPKGDVMSVAEIAGVMGAKRTADLIPLCHPIALTDLGVEITPDRVEGLLRIRTTAATVGGSWTLSSGASNYAVDGTVGTIRLAAGSGPAAYLNGASAPAADAFVTLSIDKPATGSGLYASVIARRVVGQGDYRAKTRFQSNGTVAVSLQRVSAAGAETALQAEALVPGLTYAVGEALDIRVQVTGSSPSTVRVKVWKHGSPEPSAWLRTATDSTPGLQGSGGVGIYSYLSSSAANAPVKLRVDDLVVIAP